MTLHLDREPEDAGRLAAGPHRHHHVSQPSDHVTVGVEDEQPRQPPAEHPPRRRRHGRPPVMTPAPPNTWRDARHSQIPAVTADHRNG
ncbi:hypothetical protein [Protofrankia coriariae]|uniref:hypothetical protein n=1 Tax=Protofrankia coriariae TaxID=1562887 RepID=UPI000AF037F8|nr:hypothetical protein [Protofrankia coriariae]